MENEHWLQVKWRPISAMVYLIICLFDFVIFPVIWAMFLQYSGSPKFIEAWNPLTLQGAGLFHLSFGAILGVSAFTRGQEKVAKLRAPTKKKEESNE